MRHGRSAGNVLPCLDLVVFGHCACKLLIELLQRGHICEARVQKIASQRLVTDITDVIVADKDTSAKVIDTLYGSDTQTLDTS